MKNLTRLSLSGCVFTNIIAGNSSIITISSPVDQISVEKVDHLHHLRSPSSGLFRPMHDGRFYLPHDFELPLHHRLPVPIYGIKCQFHRPSTISLGLRFHLREQSSLKLFPGKLGRIWEHPIRHDDDSLRPLLPQHHQLHLLQQPRWTV